MRGDDGAEIPDLLTLLAERRGVDLRDYQLATLERRVASRIEATSSTSLAAYAALVARDGEELDRLLSALLVGVTAFFRDEEVFAAIRDHVLPALLRIGDPSRPTRAWSVGCATGEEAWSVAALLADACRPAGREFEVLATDVDATVLEKARRGVYPSEAVEQVSEPLRISYFTREPEGFRVADLLRRRVRFAEHNLMGPRLAPAEAVVASFDLVLCRNVLIYFDRRLQGEACRRLVSSVRPGGALVLGPVETLAAEAHAGVRPFPRIAPRLRVFQVREGA